MNTQLPVRQPHPTRSRRGGALVTVIVLCSAFLIMAGSIIRLAITERHLTVRNALVLESRNAAEALAEYGFSQIRHKFETRSTFNLSSGGSDALLPPPTNFWSGSNVSLGSTDFELIGGTVSPVTSGTSSYYYVDPANPNNRNDPLRGKWVWRRDVSVLARATVRHTTGAPIVSHARQTISVRGAPLFAHAIFYNMDLEIAPGPTMNIFGPVHANGDLYFASKNGLNFYGQVTTSGHLFRQWKHGVGGSHGNELLSDFPSHVSFANSGGNLVSIRTNNASGGFAWNDSRLGGTHVSPDFRSFAANTWNGNLLTAAHGITDYRPVAIGEYREANPTNPSVALKDASLDPSNSGRLLIEPGNHPTNPAAPDYAQRKEIEYQKYANDAGIHIRVVPPTTVGGSASITVTSRSKSDPTKNKTLTLPSGSNVVEFKPYRATATFNTTSTVRNYTVEEVGTGARAGQFRYNILITTTTNPHTVNYTGGVSEIVPGSSTTSTSHGGLTMWRSTPPSDAGVATNHTSTVSGLTFVTGNGGLHDRRRKKGVNLVDIDMDALRLAVARMAGTNATLSGGTTRAAAASEGFGGLTTDDWTGIVYVEVAGNPTTDPLTGATVGHFDPALAAAANATAVRIIKGTGRVPSYGTANEGLTIATNAPMYVQGHYNADGTTSTSAATNSARVPEAGETPAALVADAITLLSPNFNIGTTLGSGTPNASGPIEISAALLTGITPTNPTLGAKGESSGGAHNFPRFLEAWTNRAVFIRGSLVALFESRIATEPWSTDYYAPPNRNWGFNDLFAQGRYPPGTPRVMSYRRVNFEHIDPETYSALKEAHGW